MGALPLITQQSAYRPLLISEVHSGRWEDAHGWGEGHCGDEGQLPGSFWCMGLQPFFQFIYGLYIDLKERWT